MATTARVLLLATFLASGCADVPAISGATEPVVAGRAEAGYAPVGHLVAGKDLDHLTAPWCGITLIAPTVAVTAAHCVADLDLVYGVSFGDIYENRVYLADSVVRHPGRVVASSTRYRHDLAVLLLKESVDGITPAQIARARVDDACDGETRYVGYGRTTVGNHDVEAGYSGDRRSASHCVDRVDGYNLFVHGLDGGLCWGDSGGPLMSEGGNQIYGVLGDFDGSFYCDTGNRMIFTSLADELGFLEPFLDAAGQRLSLLDSDRDGVTDVRDLCASTADGADVWTTGDWNGCATGQIRDRDHRRIADRDDDGIADASDRCPSTPAGATVWTSGEYTGCAGGEVRSW